MLKEEEIGPSRVGRIEVLLTPINKIQSLIEFMGGKVGGKGIEPDGFHPVGFSQGDRFAYQLGTDATTLIVGIDR